jgi:hypothetical protein
MAARQLTQVYLDPGQKQALQNQAKKRGTKLSEQIRLAIDAYLSGITSEELELLLDASIAAEKEILAMSDELDIVNKKLDGIFAEMDELRSQRDKAA